MKWFMMNAKQMVMLAVAALVLLSTPAAQAFYNPQTGRWLSRDPIGERGGRNLCGFVDNYPVMRVDIVGLASDWLMLDPVVGAGSSTAIYPAVDPPVTVYDEDQGALFQVSNWTQLHAGDQIINNSLVGVIHVRSGNLEVQPDKDFARARCVLKELGFPLPGSENGVYWGDWKDLNVNGVTSLWTGMAGSDINFSFIHMSHQGATQRCNGKLAAFIVTLYHEVQGHNLDEQEDGAAFEQKYEDQVRKSFEKHHCRACQACGIALH